MFESYRGHFFSLDPQKLKKGTKTKPTVGTFVHLTLWKLQKVKKTRKTKTIDQKERVWGVKFENLQAGVAVILVNFSIFHPLTRSSYIFDFCSQQNVGAELI